MPVFKVQVTAHRLDCHLKCGLYFFPVSFLTMEMRVSPVLLSMLSLNGGTCLNRVPSVMSACPVWRVKRLRAGVSAGAASDVVVSHFSIVFSKVCTDMVSSLSDGDG